MRRAAQEPGLTIVRFRHLAAVESVNPGDVARHYRRFTPQRSRDFVLDMNKETQETIAMFDAIIAKITPRKEAATSDDVWHFWEGYLAALHDLRHGVDGTLTGGNRE
jgi:hypothetical protein